MQPEMTEFLELIFYLTLVNIPLMGGAFTWSNNHIYSRLDRFLVSSEWKNHCPNVCQKRLSRLYSDHFPILLDYGGIQKAVGFLNLKTCS